jgi:hypothetical protein
MEFGVGAHYKILSCRYEFCKNRREESHTLCKDINEFLITFFIFCDLHGLNFMSISM